MNTSVTSAIKNTLHMKTRRLFTLLSLSILTITGLFAQPTVTSIKYEEDDQTLITITFSENITFTASGLPSADWEVKLNGVIKAVTIPFKVPFSWPDNIIKLKLTLPVTYAEAHSVPGVTVRYKGTGPAIKGVSSGLNLAAFGPTAALNQLPTNCQAFTQDKGVYTTNDGVCAPVSVTVKLTYNVKSSYRNSSVYAPGTIFLRIDWNDGVAPTSTWSYPGDDGTGKFEWTASRTFPTFGTNCGYQIRSYPGVGGLCSAFGALEQTPGFLSYNTDNQGSGKLILNPDTIKVCIGQNFTEAFNDATLFNCRKIIEPTNPNIAPRIVQFIYGTTIGDGGVTPRISNVTVNGAVQAYPYTSPLIQYYDSADVPFPNAVTYPIKHLGNNGPDAVGQVFEVTMNNWGPCNTAIPIQTVSYIKIVNGPIAIAGPDFAICSGSDATMAGSIARTAASGVWSSTGNGTWLNAGNPTGAVYSPGSNDLTAGFVNLVLTATGGVGLCTTHTDTMKLTIESLPGIPVISLTGLNGFCDNNSTSLTLTSTASPNGNYLWTPTGINNQSIVRNDFSQSGNYTVTVYSNTSKACPRTSAPFTVTIYEMATTTNPNPATVCHGAATSFGITAGGGSPRTIKWQRSTNGSPPWTDITAGNVPNDLCTYINYTTATLGITNAQNTMNNYQYRAVLTTTAGTCVTTSAAALLTVNPIAAITTQPPNRTICELGSTTFPIVIGGVPAVTVRQWQVSSDNGTTWTNLANGGVYGGVLTATLTITAAPWSLNGYWYRCALTTASCTSYSNYGTLTLNRLARISAQPPDRAICSGSNTTFTISVTTPPAITGYQWQVSTNGGGSYANLANVGIYSGVTTATLTLTGATTAYDQYLYRCTLSTGGPCSVNSSGGLLTVHPLPVDLAVAAADAWLCYNTGTNINLSASEGSVVYQLRNGVTGIGGTQTGDGTTLGFSTTPLTVSTTFNIYAAKTTTIGTSTKTCNRQMTQTPLVTVNPNLTLPNLSHSNVCLDGLVDLPQANPAGGSGTYTYSWTGTGGYTNNVQDPAAFTPGTSGAHSYDVTVTDQGFKTASIDNTVCTVSDNIAFTVNPLPALKTIAPVLSLVCYNTGTNINIPLSVVGIRYDIYKTAGPVLVGSVNGNGGTVSVPSGNLTANTSFYGVAVNTTTLCDVTLNTITVNVNPQFSLAQFMDNTSICINTAANINVVMTGGTSPYTVNYTKNGAGQPAWTPYISGTNVTTGNLAANTTYALTSVTDNNGCAVQSLGSSILITVGAPLTGATLTGSGNACFGATSTIKSVITGGAPPYTINYTRNLVAQPPITPYTSNTDFSLGVLPVGTYNYKITSVTDACGNSVPPAGLPLLPYTIVINPFPDASGTVNNTADICNNGTTDIVLHSTVPSTDFIIAFSNLPAVTWQAGKSPVALTVLNGEGVSVAQQLAHNGTGPVTVTYSITPRGPASTLCTGTAVTRTVIVQPTVLVTATGATLCAGGTTNIDVNTVYSATNGIKYNWTVSAPAGVGGAGNGPAGGVTMATNIGQTLTNSNTSSQKVTYTITGYTLDGVGALNCAGTPLLVDVWVEPTVLVTATGATVCAGGSTNIDVNTVYSATNGIKYNWTVSAPAGVGGAANGPAGGVTMATNIGQTLTNSNTSSQKVTYTITGYTLTGGGALNCAGTPLLVDVWVEPTVLVTATGATLCAGGTTNIDVNTVYSATNGIKYNWTVSAPAGVGGAANGPAGGVTMATNIGQTLTNSTTASQKVTYTITGYTLDGVGALNCAGTPLLVDVWVEPTVLVTATGATLCAGGTTNIDVNTVYSATNGIKYNWTVSAPAGVGGAGNGPAGGVTMATNIGQTLTNSNTSSQKVTYTITGYTLTGGGALNCAGTPLLVDVWVEPTVLVTATGTTLCAGGSTNIDVNTVYTATNGIKYNWTVSAPAGVGGAANGPAGGVTMATNIGQTLTNSSTASQKVTYTITGYTLDGVGALNCAGTPLLVDVWVEPTVLVTATGATVCAGGSTNIDVNTVYSATNGIKYNWTVSAPAGVGGTSNGPAGGVTMATNIGQTLTNSNTSSQKVTYTITGYTLDGVGALNCAGTPLLVDVWVEPTVLVTATGATLCAGGTTNIDVNTVYSATNGIKYNWTVSAPAGVGGAGNGPAGGVTMATNIGQTLTNSNTSSQKVTYTITGYTLTGGGALNCAGTPLLVDVWVEPTVLVTATGTTLCAGGTTNIDVNSVTTATNGIKYNWTVSAPAGVGGAANGPAGGVTMATNIGQTLTNSNTSSQKVTYTITGYTLDGVGALNCAGTPLLVDVWVEPTVLVTAAGATICNAGSTNIDVNTVYSATNGIKYNWTVSAPAGVGGAGNGPAGGVTMATNIAQVLTNSTLVSKIVTYTITGYTLDGGGALSCAGTPITVDITVNPIVTITAGQNPSICSGNTISYKILLDNYINPADNVTFTWPAPTHSAGVSGGTARGSASSANIGDTYVNASGGIGTVTYSVTAYKDGCTGPAVNVIVNVASEPVLYTGPNTAACSKASIGLVLKEAVGSVIPTDYYIVSKTLGGGLTESGNAPTGVTTSNASYLFNDKYTNITGVDKTVTYRVQPMVGVDCIGAEGDVVVIIHPEPVVVPGQTGIVCSGTVIGKEVKLIPANTPAGTKFSWPLPFISDMSVQGTAQANVAADPNGTLHINDIIHNTSGGTITARYDVTPVSSLGCSGTMIPVIITINPEPLPPVISGRDKLCVNVANEVYSVPATGSSFTWTVDAAVGTKTFDFSTNAIMIKAAAAAGSGNITVFETNTLTCSGDPYSLPVEVFTVPDAEDISGPVTVCANSTQVYSVTNRLGSIYNWTIPGGALISGDPTADSITIIYGNVGGLIKVKETTAAGCVRDHNDLNVTVKALPTATISGGLTICDGATANLSVDFTGTGPYTFTYAHNGIPQVPAIATAADPYTLPVTAAGTYTIVNVTDANCTNSGTGTTTVLYHPKPTGIISGSGEMCNGSTKTLTMTFTGVPPYNFTYTDGTTPVTVPAHLTSVYTVSVSPLVNTNYTLVSLTDGNLCTGVVSGLAAVSVNQPPALSLSGTNIVCYNGATGAINMTITGGTAPFGIAWTGPDSYTETTQNISGLKAGYYAVVVTDTKGCTGTANITLTQLPALTGSAAGTNITCFGASDGTITISGYAGGSGSLEYTINGGTGWSATPTFSGLAPGTYNVKMRDAVNPTCVLTLNGALQLTTPAVLNASYVKTDVNCYNANNGSIVISSPTGGYGTYGYTIDGGSTWQGSGNFTNLPPAFYNVQIRDAANPSCVKTLIGSLEVTEPVVLSATVTSTNVTCYSLTDGTITISAPGGGHASYEYSINGGGSWQNTGTYSGLAPTTYNVQIRDAVYPGCIKVLSGALVITQPPVLQASVASTNVTCNGAADGTISITGATGGYTTYDYTINGGTSWQLLGTGLYTGLAPGTYDVRIRDAAHTACEIILNSGLQITQPAVLSAMVVRTDISCFGAADGIITVTNSAGGYGTYEYTIDGGVNWQVSNTFTLLDVDTYDVRIRDKAHILCEKIIDGSVTILEPAVLNAAVNSTNVTCNSAADGTITISGPVGGSGSYGYSINGGTSWQGSGSFTNLVPGTYNIRIRDAVHTGCVIPLLPAITITEQAALSATVVRTNVTCFNAADGTITINGAAGGYGLYDYTINGGATWVTTNSFISVSPGFYNVKIRDRANPACIFTVNGSLSVTQPPVLSAAVAKTNVTCNGANNGTITVSAPTGGYGTYQYSINGAAGPWVGLGSFTNLPPAIYDVRIRDAANTGCFIVLAGALQITEPPALTATVTPTMISCKGANNGIITITGAAGGYGTYEYTIDGGTNWSGLGNFTNLIPGVYDVRIRDAAQPACVITLAGTLSITEPLALSATVNKTNITCFGAGDGTITITFPVGGYGTYDYSINGGGSWQNTGSFSSLTPGNYNVQIRDAAHTGCVKVLNNSLQITQPSQLNAVVTPTNVTCNGANDGKITITAPTGGLGTYDYSVDGGITWQLLSGTFIGLVPATYDVRIRDAVNTACIIDLNNSLTITEPAPLGANVNSTNVTCFGSTDGTITVTSPVGGYGTYEYSKDGGLTWQATGNFTNLAPAAYIVQIRDKAHVLCVATLSTVTITAPPVLAATVNSTNVTCFGAGNGTITVSGAAGGYGTYQYNIVGTTWQNSGTFTGLTPATYTVKIRDAANTGCVITLGTAAITEPNILAATVNSTNVTCYNAGDGTITVSAAAGGYGTYDFTVNGGTSWQPGGNFTALIPGFYNVQIRDRANPACVIILNGSLQITQPPVLSANVSKTNVTCNSANDGTITISSPTGGYGTYEYSIDGTAWQVTGNFMALAPGFYSVQIRDKAHIGCFIVLSGALEITEPLALGATVTPTMITCNGAADGIITITLPVGGYGTYQYSKNGGGSWQGSGTFTNLAPGNYDVRMRDAANPACELTLNGSLPITEPAVLNATVAKTNVTCFGGSNGTITISSPTGGYLTYEYSINGGGSWQAGGNFINLVPGTYNVQIRDMAHTGCVKVLAGSLAITQPGILNAVVTPTNITCNGANDGKITITLPTGGSGTYDYSIDGGLTWQLLSGAFIALAPSTYDVQIRDAVNTACIITLNSSVTISEPDVLNASVASTNVTCFGSTDGTITVTSPVGGYGTYEYSKDGGLTWQATGNFTNLAPAAYIVQIRDKAHVLCVATLSTVTITAPPVLSATVASTNVTCFGAGNGTITVSGAAGGYGTYQYNIVGTTWQNSGTFTGLTPATYTVKIRDAANTGCVITLGTAAITEPNILAATVNSTNVTCYNAGDGTITVSAAAGGYGTYDFTVNGGTSWQPTGTFTALIPGFYNVQIRDRANPACVIILNGSLQITQPPVLSANVAKTNVTCNSANDGTITVSSPTGGYGTYEYSIDGTTWQATGNFIALAPGFYSVQIRDKAHIGCFIVLSGALEITEPLALGATVTPTMVTCNGAADGIITITLPVGGYGTYQYSKNGGGSWQGSGTFTNLAPGNYDVRMRDAANPACELTLSGSLPITEPAVLNAVIASTNVTCYGGNDGTITISGATGGYLTYEYSINGGGTWQAAGNFIGLTPGSYNILIRDMAHTGCVKTLNSSYPVTQPGLLTATVAKTDVTCNGAGDGTITISAPGGGNGTYQYSIDGGLSWQGTGNYTALATGTYDVRIRDAAHTACSVILYPNLVITEPLVLAMTSTGNILLDCFGDNDGMGTFYASGGTLPYTFSVVASPVGTSFAPSGFNSKTFFNAIAGVVTVAVTDFKGCFATATINITQPLLLTPGTIGTNQVLCSGDNPAELTETGAATGGPGAYSYQWQYSSTIAGTYITIAGANLFQYTPPAGATNTTYYRRMVSSGICTPVYSNVIEVKVNPKPVAILSGGETICPFQTSILKVNVMIGTGPYTLNIQNHGVVAGYVSGSDIIVNPLVTTTYKLLSVKDANNCEVLDPSANLMGTATVTVRALPAIITSPVNKTICEFGMVNFTVAASGTDLTYQWYVDDGLGFDPVVDGGIYFGATNSTLSLFGATRTMNNYVYRAEVTGCASTVTSAVATLTVNTVPGIGTQPSDSTICMGSGATFSVAANGTGLIYKWQVNKGAGFIDVVNDVNFSGAALPVLTITNAPGSFNNYIFKVIISGTCGAPVHSNFAVLRVNTPPVATANPANKAVCQNGGPVYFTGNGSGLIDSIRWQVSTDAGVTWSDVHDNAIYSGATSQQLAVINIPVGYNNNRYRLALKAVCVTSYTTAATLTVHSNPVVDFTAVDPVNACGGVPVIINGNPTGGSGTYSQHTWTGDVGPLNNYFIQSPTFNSQIAGIYNLNYKVKDSNGCTASDSIKVNVDAPDATFAQDVNYGCTDLTVSFTKDMTGITNFWWNFDDGSPVESANANPVHTFINTSPTSVQYHNVELRVQSAGGCFDTFTSMVTVYPAIDATFTSSTNIVCSGNPVTFTALPGANKYFWEYDDGVSGYSTYAVTHLFTNLTTAPVVRRVKLTTTSFYNCTSTDSIDITVMPVPLPQFSALPLTQIYNPAGNPVTFTNATNAGTWTWMWKFGDGATSTLENPVHTYTALGTYTVTLVVNNTDCYDSVKHTVSVLPVPPVADFVEPADACAPLSVTFENTSLNTATPGTTYKWDFGDGSTSTAKNPSYTYYDAGIYTIELTVTGPGGISSIPKTIEVFTSPRANFEVSPTYVFVNDEKVRFFNLSQEADNYLWEFGDGDTSRVKDPFHKYMEAGVYDITLWAYSANGCSNKFVLSPGVTVEPAGEVRFSTVFTPNKDGPIDRTDLPTGGTEIDQFFFPPIREKVIDYKLQIFNRLGVLIFQSNDINKPWNGYYKGNLCQQGVYIWYVEGKFANGQPFKKVGDVTLLH